MKGSKRFATTKLEKNAVKRVRELDERQRTRRAFVTALNVLPILLESATSAFVPHTLAVNVHIEDFFAVVAEHEHTARKLCYENGTILITEVPSAAHDRLIHLFIILVERASSVFAGAGSVEGWGTTDIVHGPNGSSVVQPDASFRPEYTLSGTSTFLIQILDSTHISDELQRSNSILASANAVQAILLVKMLRYVRPAVLPLAGANPPLPRTVGPHTFSDVGFLGDRIPGANELNPVSEMIFILKRRGVAMPTIVRSALGPVPAAYVLDNRDNVAVQLPGVPVGGGNPGPFVANNPLYSIVVPWADIFHVSVGGAPMSPAVAAAMGAVVPGAGFSIDPHDIWRLIKEDARYSRRHI